MASGLTTSAKLTSTECIPLVAILSFSGASRATIFPWLIMAILSHNWWASSMSWVVRKMVVPVALRPWSRSLTRRALCTSRLEVGSSKKSTRGSLTSAMDKMRRCFIPLEYVLARSSFRSRRPSSWSMLEPLCRASFLGTLYSSAISMRFLQPDRSE